MSRTLVVLRHAKSDWPEGVPDHERPLAARGRRDAPEAGRWIAQNLAAVDRVVRSTAVRAQQTWDLASAALVDSPRTVDEERVYDASVRQLLDVIRETPDDVRVLVLVGHNPGSEGLVDHLAGTAASDARQRIDEKYPTCGLAVLEHEQSWSNLSQGQAHLAAFVVPRG